MGKSQVQFLYQHYHEIEIVGNDRINTNLTMKKISESYREAFSYLNSLVPQH